MATNELNIKVTLTEAANKGLQGVGLSVKELQKAVNLSARSLNAFSKNLKDFKLDMGAAEKEAKQLNHTLRTVSTRGAKQFGDSLVGLRRGVNGTVKSLMSLKTMLLGVGAGLLAKSFVEAGNAAENYRVRLKTVLGTQHEANLMFKEVAGYAATVSFEYKDLMESATRLAGIMEGGSKEVQRYLPLIADLAAATGVGINEATGQIIRMYSAGAASADLFRERGVLALLGFQAGVKYTAEETREQLFRAFEDPQSKFRDASKELSRTWSGLMSMLSDRWFQFRNDVMESGVFDYMKAAMDILLGSIDQMKKEGDLSNWAENLARKFIGAFGAIAKAGAIVADIFRGWRYILSAVNIVLTGIGMAMLDVVNVLNRATNIALAVAQKINEAFAAMEKMFSGGQSAFHKGNVEMIKNLRRGIGVALKSNDEFRASLSKSMKESGDYLSKNADQQESYYSKVKRTLKEIDDLVKKRRERRDIEAWGPFQPSTRGAVKAAQGTGTQKGVVTFLDLARGTLRQFNDELRTQLALIDQNFAAFGQVVEYYDVMIKKAEEAFFYERKLLNEMLEAAKTDKERYQIRLQMRAGEQEYQRKMIEFETARAQAIADRVKKEKEALEAQKKGQREAGGIVTGAAQRAIFAGGGLTAEFAQQQQQLEARQLEEQAKLIDLKKKGYAEELDLFKLHQAHILEQEKLTAEQRSKLVGAYFGATKSVLGNVSNAFSDFYKATGERHKEFFHIYKAAAIAETIIGTYQSAQDAYKALAGIPYVGPALAAAAAGAAVAAGVARVAVIRAQRMAEGGLVGDQDMTSGGAIMGYSPHSKSDNVPVHATAGEFMHPVSTVKHYGVQAMEAIRQRLVPRDVLTQFASPNLRAPAGVYMASGGMVASGGASSYSVNVPITTIDTINGIAGKLQGEVENTVRRVMNEELS